jgi:carboxyl-terminal processing protease
LRDNPGGILSAAIGVSDMFLDKGSVIVTLKSRTSEEPEKKYTSGRRGYKQVDMPMAILVNNGSASASEVMAGALLDNNRATLVGQRTYGKASVQSVVKMSLRPECAVKLTTGYYYTPNGALIHGKGIEPDEEVLMTLANQRLIKRHYMREVYRVPSPEDEPSDKLDDKQLKRAIAVLCQKED